MSDEQDPQKEMDLINERQRQLQERIRELRSKTRTRRKKPKPPEDTKPEEE
jgi:hypothetical protein